MRRFFSCVFLWILTLSQVSAVEDRIWFAAEINGRPVRMIFDTGCSSPVLFTAAANRLKLKVTNPPPGTKAEVGAVLGGVTEPCDFTLWGSTVRTPFRVVQLPTGFDFFKADGMLGWHNVRHNVFSFSGTTHRMIVGDRTHPPAQDWQKFPIQENSGCLILGMIRENKSRGSIMLDTGANEGVSLSPERWQMWKKEHPLDPVTYTSYYMPGAGLCVDEMMLAPQLKIGPLTMTQVLIRKANIAERSVQGSANLDASLPFSMLNRRDLFIDGQNGQAYISPELRPPTKLNYNRLGAVFVPQNLDSTQLLAHVVKNSPAEKAGIQNGDVLVKLGSQDTTNWKKKRIDFASVFAQPAGTKLTLVLKREGQIYQTSVVLENFLEPFGSPAQKR